MTKTTKREVKMKSGLVIPQGAPVELELDGARGIRMTYQGTTYRVSASRAHLNFGRPFIKPPGIRTLERWMFDGIAKTYTGKRTEPDGTAEDGSASWLLVFGMI